MTARRALAAFLLLAAAAQGCAFLRDPVRPWQVDLSYEINAGRVVAVPASLTVDGPLGYVVLTNQTTQVRGFAIDALAVYERISPGASVRIRVEEVRNHRTYHFYDHLHPGTIRGSLVSRFVAAQLR